MRTHFRNRIEAGRLLAENLINYANNREVIVLALPRGGVPVGAVVARRLQVPLDVFVVRKLGVPGHEELGMGALAGRGLIVLNNEILDSLRIPKSVVDSVVAKEQRELDRREQLYRDGRQAADVEGKTVIIVDDGIATGSTMLAAVAALRKAGAARIVVAAPTIASATYYHIRAAADDVAALIVPEVFRGVGEWYEDFSQTSDDEVRALLAHVDHAHHDSR